MKLSKQTDLFEWKLTNFHNDKIRTNENKHLCLFNECRGTMEGSALSYNPDLSTNEPWKNCDIIDFKLDYNPINNGTHYLNCDVVLRCFNGKLFIVISLENEWKVIKATEYCFY